MNAKQLLEEFCRHASRDVDRAEIQLLLHRAATEGIAIEDLLRLMIGIAAPRLQLHATRAESEGSGNVKKIEFHDESFVLRTWNNDEYEYASENGYRWRSSRGWISRDDLERALGTWPGYLDAVEDFFYVVLRRMRALEVAERKQNDDYHRRWDKAFEDLHSEAALDRHPMLRLWRSRNACNPNEVPASLRSVRHVKRIEVSEPCYVYFLLKENDIVYVGQSTAPWPSRILQHLKEGDKDFDDVWYVEVDRPSLNAAEKAHIERFKPRYNRAGVPKIPARALTQVHDADQRKPLDGVLNELTDGNVL